MKSSNEMLVVSDQGIENPRVGGSIPSRATIVSKVLAKRNGTLMVLMSVYQLL